MDDLEKATQKELAIRVGISQSHLSLILAGKRNPSLRVAKKLADVLGVTIDSLLAKVDGTHDNEYE
jgi:transcriptional regulator with XRE-family HTH domain